MINPRSLLAQIKGGACLGIAHALFQKSIVDPRRDAWRSLPLQQAAVDSGYSGDHARRSAGHRRSRDARGARGVGEPPVGAGYGAVLDAIADAVVKTYSGVRP